MTTVDAARLPSSLLDEVAEEGGAWRKFRMVEVAVKRLVHAEYEPGRAPSFHSRIPAAPPFGEYSLKLRAGRASRVKPFREPKVLIKDLLSERRNSGKVEPKSEELIWLKRNSSAKTIPRRNCAQK